MHEPRFALIDCNNFFVSCERLFRPDLEGRPVVVLSSNDGCAVSRSAEAKALGIPMGAPAFKYRELFRKHGVVQFSGNFELYGDISERITRLLTKITPRTEVYSVDEAFLDLHELDIPDYTAWGKALRERILHEIGIPVSIGFAGSKTLAKLANDRAKKTPELGGVLDLITASEVERERYLLQMPIEDIWGIGWRLAPKLKAEGIFTALDVARMRPQLAKQLMGIQGRQMVTELNGTSCHPLERIGRVRQQIMSGRMFGHDTTDLVTVEAALASLTARAAFSLRREKLLAQQAIVSLKTSRHKPGYRRQDHHIRFDTPTADTGFITGELLKLMQTDFSASAEWHRANVMLYDFVARDYVQPDLLGAVDLTHLEQSNSKLQAVDDINKRYGKRTIRFAAEDLSTKWEPKHRLRSPRYTTRWSELPVARIL